MPGSGSQLGLLQKNFPALAPVGGEGPPTFGQWGYLHGLSWEPKIGPYHPAKCNWKCLSTFWGASEQHRDFKEENCFFSEGAANKPLTNTRQAWSPQCGKEIIPNAKEITDGFLRLSLPIRGNKKRQPGTRTGRRLLSLLCLSSCKTSESLALPLIQ